MSTAIGQPEKQQKPQELVFLSAEQLFEKFGTTPTGLSAQEAEQRLLENGPNEVERRKKTPPFIQFISHFRSPLTIILIAAAIVSGFLSDPIDAIIIVAMVVLSVVLDFTQEFRAEKAVDSLLKRVATTATVLRDGAKTDIEVSQLVPGDIVLLSAGDISPADLRLIAARDFFVDQSALTGESFPVEKNGDPVVHEQSGEHAWLNYVFMGSSVTAGSGTAVVVRTGSSTQYGDIAKRSAQKKPETEFEGGLRRFGYLIMQVTFVLVIAVFFVNAVFKRSLIDSLLFSVALAVGLTPGLLPVILSINLARGASAMSKKGVIVKRLSAIQDFGSMDVLCSDKTGTLTQNIVTVIRYVDLEGTESPKVLSYCFLNSLYQTGLRSPLDDAVLKHEEVKDVRFKKVDEIPFDFTRKRLSIVVSDDTENLLITKGAPEEISKTVTDYEFAGHVDTITPAVRAKIEQQYLALSAQGFRVLGVAYRKDALLKTRYSVSDESNLIFLGFIAFTDPLKETAGESLVLLRQAGIKLKILTGDNEVVTGRACNQLGFQVYQYRRGRLYDAHLKSFTSTLEVDPINIVKSSEIENLNDDALIPIVEAADIFTRVTPGQKNRILNALRANGHVVGYLGDGINDAPSMRMANVSISVTNAVDIAKESADFVLLRNDLKVIAEGVAEGRKTFGNTMKYIQMAISSNFGNMFSAAGASLFLPFLPMLPVQLLLNNLLYSSAQISLPSDNVDDTYVRRPQRMVTSFIRDFMLIFGPISSIFDFATFLVLIFVFKAEPALFRTAWFVESLSTQSLVIFVIRTRYTPFFKAKPAWSLVINVFAVLAVAIMLPYFPLTARTFGFVPLPITFLLVLVAFVVAYLWLVEFTKNLFYRGFFTRGRAPGPQGLRPDAFQR